jgi:hypothetical protein
MATRTTGTAGEDSTPVPTSTPALEAEIQARREHLAATIDELTARTKPQALARSGLAGVTRKVQTVTHTPEGQLRVERLAAVAGAAVVLAGALIWLRRRR